MTGTKNLPSTPAFVSGQFVAEEKYWLNKLSGDLPRGAFPTGWTGKNHKTVTGKDKKNMEIIEFTFDNDVFTGLMKLRNGSDLRLFIILTALVKLLLRRYTGIDDIIVGTPCLKQKTRAQFINTVLALRSYINRGMTLKELLLTLKQTVYEAFENQNYPINMLAHRLNMEIGDHGFPLFDIAVLLRNIQDKDYIRPIPVNMLFSFSRTPQCVEGMVEYNAFIYKKTIVEGIIAHLKTLAHRVLHHIDRPLARIDMLTKEEKHRLLWEFNNTDVDYPGNKTLHGLFAEQVEKTPHHAALRFHRDLSDIYRELKRETINDSLLGRFANCCFKKNPYLFAFDNEVFLNYIIDRCKSIEQPGIHKDFHPGNITLLRTHRHNLIAVNRPVLSLLKEFNGKVNLKSIFRALRGRGAVFGLLTPVPGNEVELKTYSIGPEFKDIVLLVKALSGAHLVKLVDYRSSIRDIALTPKMGSREEFPRRQQEKQENGADSIPLSAAGDNQQLKSPVLLLGDTVAAASTGILYLASYLRRKGIEAYCQWNDLNDTPASLQKNIEILIKKFRPRLVGISMKWFPHIARVLETARMIKACDASIKVVLGGNTASFFYKRIIRYEAVDYIIRGDGERPLLALCRGEKNIPNCVYKKGKEIITNPITYVQDEQSSSDIFLSHLDKIFVSPHDPLLTRAFYINTGKGCSQQCFYCAGCRDVQEQSFNRAKPFLRGINEVRTDIIAARNYTGTYMFDFDLPLYDSVDYYKKIWFGIDLSRHFCEFYFWTIPSPEFIAHISRTFKYAYLNIDLCSFSQEHRRQLAALGLVKPQPTDNQVFSFCDLCREYQNIEFGITLIAGLPYFTYKDIDAGNDFLARLTERYANFRSVQWGRLHAQPGAPILDESKNKNFGIQHHSLAKEFDDFLHYSELNYKCQKYPDLEEMHYPLVYLNDDALNSKISHHYSDINKRIHRHLNTRQSQTTALLEVTYRELNQKVGEAAAGLRGQGMQPDDIIALKVKPSLEMIVGILGILEAGGAYLPIDPDYPEERIDYMLKDSGAKILLTGQDIADFHPSQALSSKNRVNHHSKNLAYIIYTSGTTGRPKGAAVEHRQAVNTLLSRKIEYKMQPGDSALQLFSYAFDGFVTAFFTPIISGSTVVFLEGDGAKNPMKMKEAVAKFKITHFISVPALFRSIIEYLTPEEASSLKVITLAGDRLSPGVPEMAGQKNKHLEIAHEYGVTEAAVMSTLFRHQEKNRQITVGRPVGNTKLYIICPRQGQWLQPIGIPGELCIAGAGVSRGYLNNPQLTAEKFIKNSYSKKQRLYKTGDLARWLPDGSVEFLGRIDRQVKIRGFRIEPGEIETLLMKHPRVKEAVLTAPRDETGEKFLCAYVVPNPKAGTELIENLGNHLSKSLPAYMVPPYIKTVEKIPLTPNGKIDRNALPEPVITGSNEKYTAPRNELEEKLVHLWARVLKIEKHIVGIDTNFFDIGGHSLNATILITEIHKALDVNVPMMEIFKQPTIKGLSDYILAAGKDKYTAIPLVEKKEYYPLSSAQKRLYIIQQLNLQSTVYNIPQMVELDGEPDPHLLEKVFKKLIHRHESLRTAFELVDGEPVQRIYESHEVEFKIERSTAGTETGFVRPFELSRAPLMRVELITKAKNNYLLMIDMHHITADGFSHEIMVREFVSLYAADPLPELMLQYKDYCQWQQSDQVKKTIRQQEAYWLNVFPGNIPELSLPTDYPRPLIQNFTGDSLEFTLGKTAANDLNKMASQENVSLYMILLALTNVWLSRLCNQEDIIIGIYTTGRTHADLEQIIGMFLKTLALRTYPKTNSSFNEFLAEVKESTLEAFENQDYPFESLVKKVMAQRKSNRNPLFDAAIDLHNDADKKFSGSSTTGDKLLKVKPYPYEMRESKLDIGIIVLQTADNLFFTVEYSTQLFKKETIESFFEYFKDIVSQVITNRNIKLKEINPLNPFVSPEPVRPVMEFDF